MNLYLDGRGLVIKNLTHKEVRSLRRMINSANLNERRDFHDLKEQIDDYDNKGLLLK